MCLISIGNFDIFDLGYFSIAGGSKEIVSTLAEKGVIFDDCFEVSAKYHQHELCDWLLKTHKWVTLPLGRALEYYNDAVFLFLSKNGYGNISLFDACWHNSVEAVTHLINDKGARVEERGFDGLTPLHFASGNGNINVVRYLVEACAADVHAKDGGGYTALDFAKGNAKAPKVPLRYNYGPADKRGEVERYLQQRMKK